MMVGGGNDLQSDVPSKPIPNPRPMIPMQKTMSQPSFVGVGGQKSPFPQKAPPRYPPNLPIRPPRDTENNELPNSGENTPTNDFIPLELQQKFKVANPRDRSTTSFMAKNRTSFVLGESKMKSPLKEESSEESNNNNNNNSELNQHNPETIPEVTKTNSAPNIPTKPTDSKIISPNRNFQGNPHSPMNKRPSVNGIAPGGPNGGGRPAPGLGNQNFKRSPANLSGSNLLPQSTPPPQNCASPGMNRNDNRTLPLPPGGKKQSPNERPVSKSGSGISADKNRPQVPRRDLTDLFPIKVYLPNDKQAVLRCSKDANVIEFIELAISKLKQYMQFDPNGKYEMITENSDKLDPSIPLVQNAFLKEAYESHVVPLLFLIAVGAKTRTQSMYIAKSLDSAKEEIARLVNQFEVQFLLPGGSNLSLSVSADSPLAEVKEKVCSEGQLKKKLLLLNHTLYQFRTYTDILLEDEHLPIGNVPYISQCRKHCTIPKLVLVQKPIDPFTEQEKKRALDIHSLVGKPLVTAASDEVEITNFRATMARLRYLERKRKKDVGGKARDRVSLRIINDPMISNSNTIMASITFPLLKVKKTIIIHYHETATMFIDRVFDKYYSKHLPYKKSTDFVFKVAGLREFIYGDHFFYSFEYIRRKLAKNEKIELVLTERTAVDIGDDEDEVLEEQWQQGGEEMLEACTIKYDHFGICSENMTWDQKTHISIWEISEKFRIRILGVESISNYYQFFPKVQDGGYYFYIAAGLYHGGEPLVPLQFSDKVTVDSNPRWYQWLTYPIELRNIPRGTRICFTLFATTKSGPITKTKKDIPIGWVNCQLISYNQNLKTGVQSLNMWRDEKANPIGTCVQNSVLNASSLFVEFDSYQLPVVFPTKDPEVSGEDTELVDFQLGAEGLELIYTLERVDKIIKKDPLYILTEEEKKLLWKHRKYCFSNPSCLPKFLVSIPYASRNCVQEMHRLLVDWDALHPLDALELLDYRFADAKVREFAVKCLGQFEDADLQTYLLQLVQVLKYEPYHDSALARFLTRRALRSQRVGHVFFWYLKGEMHVPEISERYGLLLEAYLHGCSSYLYELTKQNEILNSLQSVANHIKTVSSNERKEIMINLLKKIEFPEKFQLPLDPSWEAKSLVFERCKFMDSKKLPLWLVFNNADSNGGPITVIFKSGDDLRQDMLTLQIIRIMDKLWKSEGLDLQLSPYGCISTGDEVGMIEVVLNSATTAQISREAGGAAGALKKAPLAQWIQANNPGENEYEQAVQRFIFSCAGYCVATFVLGIGDRHNDNIMVTKNGRLFHIDFGHFLGNFKKKLGVSRERAKFVFTPDFAYVMGGVTSPNFHRFVTLCCEAYNILRKHASKFINLLAMMLSTGIPELTKPKDIDYLRKNLCLDMEKEDAAAFFVKQISASLGCKTTIVNNFIHILAH